MKCQKCDRPATYHITELTGPTPVEVHLCEQHAQEYLGRGNESSVEMTQAAEQMAQQLAKHMIVGQAAEEMKRLDQQSCPYCGITFYKFRNQGRLGCPHDYQVFVNNWRPSLRTSMEIRITRGRCLSMGLRPRRLVQS
jgi:protein arginine kinase activator